MDRDNRQRILRVYARGIGDEQAARYSRSGAELTELEVALVEAVEDLGWCESTLRRAADQLAEVSTRTSAHLDAGPEDRVYPLRTLGQTADDYNRMVGVHEATIRRIRVLWELQQKYQEMVGA